MSTSHESERFRTIVVPLDGSELSEQIFYFLPRICPPAETYLHLVGVFQPWTYGIGLLEPIPNTSLEMLRQSWQALLTTQQERLSKAGYTVTTHLREGDVVIEIFDVASTVHADLIAMSTHGRSGFTSFALGSIAERVLQDSPLPLLLVKQSPPAIDTPIRNIVVTLDGSELAEQALSVARRLVAGGNVRVTLLRVVQELDKGNRRILFRNEAEAEATMQQWLGLSNQYLHDVAQRSFDKQTDVQLLALRGDPDETICSVVCEVPADLIVMSTHGRTGISRWIYGSVANKVLRRAACPVLMVRSKASEL